MSRKFSASCRFFRRGCWNCILRVQGNILTENSFISKFFFHFWTLSDFFDQFLQKKSPSCPNWIFSFNGNFRVKVFCKTYKLFLFEYRAKNFRLAVRKKSAGLLCCFLRLHGDFLKKKFLKSFCIFCGPFFRSIPVIEQEKFGRPVKTAFIVSIKSIWKKLFQKTNESFHHFQTLSRKFSASCRFFRRVC